jgi:hypothetical protein
VRFHGRFPERQLVGDLGIRPPPRYQFDDSPLPMGQGFRIRPREEARDGRVGPVMIEDAAGGPGGQPGFAGGDRFDRGDDVQAVVLLQQVAPDARSGGPVEIAVTLGAAEDGDTRRVVRQPLDQPCGDGDPVRSHQLLVDEDDVRPQLPDGGLDGVQLAARVAHHHDLRVVGEEGTHPAPDHGPVEHQQQPDRTSGSLRHGPGRAAGAAVRRCGLRHHRRCPP